MTTSKDLLSRRKSQEQDLQAYLEAQKQAIPAQISGIGSNLQQSNATNTEQLVNLIPVQYQGGFRTGLATRQPMLQAQTDAQLAEQKFTQERARMQMIYENAIQMAQQAGYDKRDSEQFAQSILQQKQDQARSAALQEQSRQFKIADSKQALEYGANSQNLKNSFQPNMHYDEAVLSALLGTVGSIGLQYYLGRPNQVQQPMDFSAGLRENTAFTPRGNTSLNFSNFNQTQNKLYPTFTR